VGIYKKKGLGLLGAKQKERNIELRVDDHRILTPVSANNIR